MAAPGLFLHSDLAHPVGTPPGLITGPFIFPPAIGNPPVQLPIATQTQPAFPAAPAQYPPSNDPMFQALENPASAGYDNAVYELEAGNPALASYLQAQSLQAATPASPGIFDSLSTWVESNPAIALLGAGVVLYLLMSNSKRR